MGSRVHNSLAELELVHEAQGKSSLVVNGNVVHSRVYPSVFVRTGMLKIQIVEKYGPGVHSFITYLEKSRPPSGAPYIVNLLSFEGKKVVPLSVFWRMAGCKQ